jgi:ATP-dependent DNA helicase DinG
MDASLFIDDPGWDRIIPLRKTPGPQRHLPAHEDCEKLDVESVRDHLRAGGTLGLHEGYEERPGQIDMCGAIAAAFNSAEHLAVEAGTGVGKSLAYLIPSILWAWKNDTPVIVSTATRNLQGQLTESDIPKAISVLGDDAANFRTALLKGRSNYACLKSISEYFAPGYWTLPEEEKNLLPGFIKWLSTTEDGDLDTYEGLPTSLFSRQGDECSGRRCPYHGKCFIYKARQKAAEAHLVIVNHSLVLAEAVSAGGGILPAYGRLVLDEAHNLESIATDALSSEFSLAELNRIIRRLLRHRSEYSRQAAEIIQAAESFIEFLSTLLPRGAETRRYGKVRGYWQDTERLTLLRQAFESPVIALIHSIHDFCNTTNDEDLAMKLSADADRLLSFINEAAFVVDGEKEDSHVYWIERIAVEKKKKKKKKKVRLVAAPLSVAESLSEMVYKAKDSVILCSATLRTGNDFRYSAKRLGLGEGFSFLTATSPFDYFRQALVLAADHLPDPSADMPSCCAALAGLLPRIFAATRGRALVLFTSFEMMNAVAALSREAFKKNAITLLVQGEGASREEMTRILKTSSRTVLFGAQSFWEGVDVAGDALSCVVIPRLPFAHVGDPVSEARSEKVQREGGNPFRDYALPEAVIRFRQGFGRLIRTKTDRGAVIITDPRIVTKNYGSVFRRSIPVSVHTVCDDDEIVGRITAL